MITSIKRLVCSSSTSCRVCVHSAAGITIWKWK